MRAFIQLCLLAFLPGAVLASGPVLVSPEAPLQGEPLSIVYDGQASAAAITHPVSPEVYVLSWYASGDPVLSVFPMQGSGDKWSVTFRPDVRALAIQYMVADSQATDNNKGAFWNILFHDRSKNVLPGGYLALGRSYIFEKELPHHITRAEMIRQADGRKASGLFMKEFERNKDNTLAAYYYIQGVRWSLDNAPDRNARMEQALAFAEELLEARPDDPYAMATFAQAHQQFGSRHRAGEVSQRLIAEHRGHPASEEFMAWEVSFPAGGANPANRIQAGKTFLTYFPETRRSFIVDMMLPSYVTLGQFEEAKNWLDGYGNATATMYQFLANEIRKSGRQLPLAVVCMEKALSLWGDEGDIHRPPYVTQREWKQDPYAHRRHLAAVNLHMDYALALSTAGRVNDAIAPATLACELNNGEELKVITHYMWVMTNANEYRAAMDKASSTMLSDMWDDPFLDQFRATYVKKTGSESGFEKTVEDLKIKAMYTRYADKMLHQEAPDFTVEVHGGGEFTLSEMKGKVVVLDFWALWCGPCMRAFPFYQEAQEYYAGNPDVLLLAVNTMENVHGEVLRGRVDDFLEENGYTFQVVYDYDRTAVARLYNVDGIPTRVTIGRDNKMRFYDRGFSGDEMFLNMRAQIDLLLAE